MFGFGKNKKKSKKAKILEELMKAAEPNLPGALELGYGDGSNQTNERDHIQYTPRFYSSDFFYFRQRTDTMSHYHRFDCFAKHALLWKDGMWKLHASTSLCGSGDTVLPMPLEDYLNTVLPKLAKEWQDLYTRKSHQCTLHLPTIEYKTNTNEMWFELYEIEIKDLFIVSSNAGPVYQEYVKRVLDNHILRGKYKDAKYKLTDNETTAIWDEETYLAHAAEIEAELENNHKLLVARLDEKKQRDASDREFKAGLAAFIEQSENHAMQSVAQGGI